jgi:hypothetical protein
MKKIVLILIYASLSQFNGYAQNHNGVTSDIYRFIERKFMTEWHYFRMQKNPLLSYEETHDEWGNWKNPFLIPEEFYKKQYSPIINVRHWADFQKYNQKNGSVAILDTNFYLIEKSDGIIGVQWDYFSDTTKLIPLDTMHLNIYDSLFLYDNRFLVYHGLNNRILCCSGNVQWDHPRNYNELAWLRRIDRIGYIRGVQFDVKFVHEIKGKQLEEIRRLRPEYSGYVYASGRSSLFSHGHILIGAPKGKEVDLIEYIFYTNNPDKTKDPDKNNIYEMRYVVPSDIKTVYDRRMERKKLSPEEWNIIKNSCLHDFYDYWELLLDIDEANWIN